MYCEMFGLEPNRFQMSARKVLNRVREKMTCLTNLLWGKIKTNIGIHQNLRRTLFRY